jgi:alpha-amylase
VKRRRFLAMATTTVVAVAALTWIVVLRSMAVSSAAPAPPGQPSVIVHLFEWKWADVARECTQVLGPKGFGGVQVSPPQEHLVAAGNGYPWWERYQPVSYRLISRSGDEAGFASMVTTCHNAGVKIYVDAVLNHMSGFNSGVGSGGTQFTKYNYPGLYSDPDFHSCRHQINNWNDRSEIQNCELVGLSDLTTESDYVRGQEAGYLNHLLSLGVDGFRLDAAKHMPAGDLANIMSRLSRPAYFYSEVIQDSGPVQSTEYEQFGDVLEFRYGSTVSNAVRSGNLSSLSTVGQGWTASNKAVVFVDNHDTQRSGGVLSAAHPGEEALYQLATVFELAFPYGTPSLMSSFQFNGNTDLGPPSDGSGHTNDVTCGTGGWICEHRWRPTANMVGFRNAVGSAGLTNWAAPSSGLIGFGRGGLGYVVLNRGGAVTQSFTTGLAAGVYCDIIHGDFVAGTCSGPTVTVNASGVASISVAGNDSVAIDTAARVTGATPTAGATPTGTPTSTGVSVTFNVNATTSFGQNVFVVGSIPALGNWNPANAVALSSANYPIWSASVSLPGSTAVQYKYIKKNPDGSVTWESTPNRSFTTPSSGAVTRNEVWEQAGGGTGPVSVTFNVNATTSFGQNVFVVGSIPALGNWNPANAVALSSANYPIWSASISLPGSTAVQYKYIKKNPDGTVVWESDPNRSYAVPASGPVSLSDTWR